MPAANWTVNVEALLLITTEPFKKVSQCEAKLYIFYFQALNA